MSREQGFPLCRDRNGKIVKGKTVKGNSFSVDIPLNCPSGSSLEGVHHTHPSGSANLSHADIQAGIKNRLKYVCVRAKRKVKCTQFNHKT